MLLSIVVKMLCCANDLNSGCALVILSSLFNDWFCLSASVYRAAIDTTETGDFSTATVLSPYIYDHQYGRFGEDGTIISPTT